MDDTETLRKVLRYCSDTLDTAERFFDAPVVMVLSQIIDIIEEGHADPGAVRDG